MSPSSTPSVREGQARALFLCDRSRIAAIPWRDAGYECTCVDLQHDGESVVDGIRCVGCDVREFVIPLGVSFVLAFPPCTDIAVSGARWFKTKGVEALAQAIQIFGACVRLCEESGAPYAVENPVSVISSHFRKPDYTCNPCDYAGYADDPASEAYTKKTCLWTGGGFVMPEPRRVTPTLGSKMHLLPPSADRGDLRSVTPQGFARAVFQANARKAVRDVA